MINRASRCTTLVAAWEMVNSALPTVVSTEANMTLASTPMRVWKYGKAAMMGALIMATMSVISMIVQLEGTK